MTPAGSQLHMAEVDPGLIEMEKKLKFTETTNTTSKSDSSTAHIPPVLQPICSNE